MNYHSEQIRIKNLNTQLPGMWYLGWSAIGALALWFLVPRFGLVQLSAASILIAAMLLFLQSPSHIRLRIAIGSCILPFDSIYSQIPYLEKLRGSAAALIALSLCLGAIGIGVKYSNRRMILTPGTLVVIALVVPIFLTGWPGSFRGGLLIVAMVFAVLTTAELTKNRKFTDIHYAEMMAMAIGFYAVLIFVFQNPISLIKSISQIMSASDFDTDLNSNRLTGFGGDYEVLGVILPIGATAGYFLFLALNSWKKYFYLLLTMIIGVSLVATGSLFAILATSLSAAWLTLQSFRKTGHRHMANLSAFALGIALSTPLISKIVGARTFSRRIDGSFSITELVNRQTVWQFTLASPNWNRTSYFGSGWPYPFEEIGTWPHNTFLTFWIMGGVIGLVLFSVVWISLMVKTLKRVIRHDQLVYIHALILLIACIHTDLARLTSAVLLFTIVVSLVLNIERNRHTDSAAVRNDLLCP